MSKITRAVGDGVSQENLRIEEFEQMRLEWLSSPQERRRLEMLASRKERLIEQIALGELGELARRTLDTV